MRVGALSIGIVLLLALAGCGGGSDSTPSSAAQIRQAQTREVAAIRREIDTRLEKIGRPAKEIACVDRNIEAMTSRQIAERMLESAPPGNPATQTAAQIEGPFAKGCP